MSDLTHLYHEVIIDHGKNPRNFGLLEDALQLKGLNPLCGDQLTLYVRIEGDKIIDTKFSGHGCAISMASSSMMTQAIKGKTVREAQDLFEAFHGLLIQRKNASETTVQLGKLAILQGVAAFPSRVKCATLAWHTLSNILAGRMEAVSTEK